jgi:hypothetical protein
MSSSGQQQEPQISAPLTTSDVVVKRLWTDDLHTNEIQFGGEVRFETRFLTAIDDIGTSKLLPFVRSEADGDVRVEDSTHDNHIVRYDGTSGKRIQDSHNITLSDVGNMTGISHLETRSLHIEQTTRSSATDVDTVESHNHRIQPSSLSASRMIDLPDPGAASDSVTLLLTESAQTITGNEKTFTQSVSIAASTNQLVFTGTNNETTTLSTRAPVASPIRYDFMPCDNSSSPNILTPNLPQIFSQLVNIQTPVSTTGQCGLIVTQNIGGVGILPKGSVSFTVLNSLASNNRPIFTDLNTTNFGSLSTCPLVFARNIVPGISFDIVICNGAPASAPASTIGSAVNFGVAFLILI